MQITATLQLRLQEDQKVILTWNVQECGLCLHTGLQAHHILVRRA